MRPPYRLLGWVWVYVHLFLLGLAGLGVLLLIRACSEIVHRIYPPHF